MKRDRDGQRGIFSVIFNQRVAFGLHLLVIRDQSEEDATFFTKPFSPIAL